MPSPEKQIPEPDLRILFLANLKLLPPEVQEPFDQWRIFKARDAVVSTVQTAIQRRSLNNMILDMYLSRLEAAESEGTIFEGIYTLAEVVEVFRKDLGIHSQYIVLVMAGQINPWGLLAFQQDFQNPAASIIDAATEMWRLARDNKVDIPALLKQIVPDLTYTALEKYYAGEGPPYA